MKIVILTKNLSESNGWSRYSLEIVKRLKKNIVTGLGLAYEDIRLRKVERMSVFFLPTYIVLRKLFFNAFHLMLNKSS